MKKTKNVLIIKEKLSELERKQSKLQEQRIEYQKCLLHYQGRDQKYFGPECRRYQRFINRIGQQLLMIDKEKEILVEKLFYFSKKS